jgi:hypothetical protein
MMQFPGFPTKLPAVVAVPGCFFANGFPYLAGVRAVQILAVVVGFWVDPRPHVATRIQEACRCGQVMMHGDHDFNA